jgi:hypothetical protein
MESCSDENAECLAFRFKWLTCGGGLGFFSMDVEASRIGLMRESANEDVLGDGKLQ